jgi:hypothetical protein
MPDRQIEYTLSLGNHLAEEARQLRADAAGTECMRERERLLRKAQQTETAARVKQWVTSPGLPPPT